MNRPNLKLTLLAAFLTFGMVFLFAGTSLTAAQNSDSEAVNWLKQHNILPRPDEQVFMATLFSIVPTSHRMVVKAGNPEKTLVLGFSDSVKVTDGKSDLSLNDLQRGSQLVVVLRRTGSVRAIHLAK